MVAVGGALPVLGGALLVVLGMVFGMCCLVCFGSDCCC